MVDPATIRDGSKGTTHGGASERARGVIDSIKALLALLPPDERELAILEISEMLKPFPQAKAERVLGKILQFPRDTAWSVEELKGKIAECGIEAKPKEVYNAVTYLARKGHIRRVGYGRYVVDGIGFEIDTADDLGGPNIRHEDEYRTSYAPKTEGGE
jgi:hypothetical protein